MKALVWLGPERMEVQDVAEPQPGPGDVIVETDAAGICGSEVEGYLGRMGNRTPPLVMGHEYAGTVTELGQGVDVRWRAKRVAVNPIIGCGRCAYCERGDRNLCPDRYLLGIAVHAVRKSGAADARRVVVIGAGTIGLGCMQAALLHGVARVEVVERHPIRREHAL